MKIAFFAYAWGADRQLDGYLSEVVSAYVGLGFQVDVFLANHFSADTGVVGFKGDLASFATFIRGQGYAGAVAINNALVLAPIVEALEGRVVSIIVDAFNHLFHADPADPFAAFRLPVHFAPIGGQFERDIVALAPHNADRVTMLSPATNGMRLRRADIAPRHTISWIASLTTDAAAEAFMTRLMERPVPHELVTLCLRSVEEVGDLSAIAPEHSPLVQQLAASIQMSLRNFEMLLQNMVTARQRVEVVDRLAPLGLALYGNRAWAKASVLSRGVFQAYQPGPMVRSHEDIMRVYNASLISVNLPQAFISESFQYRLLDIMASNALLVTKRTPNPDLHRVFGADLPVPMYDTLDELEAICAHYITHEDERRAAVARCNALVDESFSFEARALDYLRLIGVSERPPEAARAAGSSRTLMPTDIA